MSYFSNFEDQSLGSSLGCGPKCSCGPCRSGMNGFAEWYEKEQEAEPAEAPPANTPAPPSRSSQPAGSLKGWAPSGSGLGYYGLPGPIAPAVSPPPSLSPEQALLQDALGRGIRSPRRLANIIFFARHPSRRESPILANEAGLIDEWRQIMERIVLPALQQMFGSPNTAVAPRGVEPRRNRYY